MRYANAVNTLPLLSTNLTILRKGEDKAKPNPFEDITDQEKEVMQHATKIRDEELHAQLYALRERQFKKKGLSFENFKEKHMSRAFIDPKELLDIGCLDGIGYAEDHKSGYSDGKQDYDCQIPKVNLNNREFHVMRNFQVNQLLTNRFRPY